MQILEVEAMPTAGDILALTGGRLDPDNVGTPVGEVTNSGGSRPSEGQVEHRDTVQRHAGCALFEQGLIGGALRHSCAPLDDGTNSPPGRDFAQEPWGEKMPAMDVPVGAIAGIVRTARNSRHSAHPVTKTLWARR